MKSAGRTLENPPAAASRPQRLLTRVLCYDDLLGGGQAVYPFCDGRIRIGRADSADDDGPYPGGLRLFDGFLSAEHAAVVDRGGDWLIDQGSRNGTWLNGERVRERALRDGDLIEVGHTLLCYRLVEERTFSAFQAAVAAGEAALGPTRTLCPEVAALVADLLRVAASDESVLLLAETGCGKEVAAGVIHERSGRRGSLCTIDCGAIPESLFESTFFGHRRGAFTGAADQAGLITRADGGTLFLDEVANMSVACQAKLLRVIEDGRVTPLGAATASRVDVRWIAAANVDLFEAPGAFRHDLLRRLSGHVGRLPPLRRRREDLGVLAAHFLREAGAAAAAVSVAAGRQLFAGAFPGNIRQLRSALRGALRLSAGGRIEVEHLPLEAPAGGARPAEDGAAAPPPSAEAVDAALRATRGNVVRAAARLGLHPRQLYRWIERYGVSLGRYRG